jgi:hypothetical protein
VLSSARSCCFCVDDPLQNYFQVAARLGDPGAQEELGFCYANGRGCKKDKKEAAKWYRMAVSKHFHSMDPVKLLSEFPDPSFVLSTGCPRCRHRRIRVDLQGQIFMIHGRACSHYALCIIL